MKRKILLALMLIVLSILAFSFISASAEKEGIYTYVKEQPNNKSKRVVITGKENMKNFLNYIYKDATIYLDRKFNRFKKFKQLNNM